MLFPFRMVGRRLAVGIALGLSLPSTAQGAGEGDAEAPPPQSFEFWHALKELGVPTKLVVYPGEGHVFAEPVHSRDRAKRTLAWFDHYLNPR